MEYLRQQFHSLHTLELPRGLHQQIMSRVLRRRHMRRVYAYLALLVVASMALAVSVARIINYFLTKPFPAIEEAINTLQTTSPAHSLPFFSGALVVLSPILLLYCFFRLMKLYTSKERILPRTTAPSTIAIPEKE